MYEYFGLLPIKLLSTLIPDITPPHIFNVSVFWGVSAPVQSSIGSPRKVGHVFKIPTRAKVVD